MPRLVLLVLLASLSCAPEPAQTFRTVGGIGTSVELEPPPPPPDPPEVTDCLAELTRRGQSFKRTSARGVKGALTVEGPINGVLFASTTQTLPMRDPVACDFVKTLWDFAALLKDRGFDRVGTLGSYCYRCCCSWSETNQCRGVDDPEPTCSASGYSNHSFGRAVDVRYLYRPNGTRIDINLDADFTKFTSPDTCGAGLAQQTGVSRELYSLVCEAGARKLFETILTPNYNAAHRNHFHMDTGRDSAFGTITVKLQASMPTAVDQLDDPSLADE
jgi:hypothetical protein